ncbi:MAG: metallophosphoesterase [Actinomycetota bacterium]|nr:metallophosphoesterase [Actinomycetota bacterium]
MRGLALLAGAGALAAAGCQETAAPAQQSTEREATTVVWAVGDGADGGREAKQVARMIRRDRPARFLYLGDVYERGTASEFRRNYSPVYGALNRITAPTPGNHEWGNRRTGYLRYWRRAKGRRQPSYYRFRLAGWEILSLNSETSHGRGSRQQRWLGRAVRKPGTCRLAFMHRPYQSAGVHGDTRSLGALWRTLRGHARLVLSGHDHDMQRLKRRDGLTQYVSGAGGRGRYPLAPGDPRLAFGRDDRFGALRIELSAGGAKLEFRSVTGAVLDRSEVRCRPLSG